MHRHCLQVKEYCSKLKVYSCFNSCTFSLLNTPLYILYTRKLVHWLRTNCPKSLSASSCTLQTITQQERVTRCLLFTLQSIYLHNLCTRLHSQSHHAFTNGYSIYWPIKSLTRVFEFSTDWNYHLTLKMASPQVVEMSVTNNSPSQDSTHPDDLFQSRPLHSVSEYWSCDIQTREFYFYFLVICAYA